MTVASTNLRAIQAGPVSHSVNIAFTIPLFATGDLVVHEIVDATGVRTLLVEGVDYTIALTAPTLLPSAGDLVLTPAHGNLLTGETLYLERRTAQVQESQYADASRFPGASFERALDRLTFIEQEVFDGVKGSPHAPPQDGLQNWELTAKAGRLGKYLRFNEVTGIPEMATPPTMGFGVAQALSGVNNKEFLSIPDWVRRVTILFSGVDTTISANLRMQLGDATSFKTSGYQSNSTTVDAIAPAVTGGLFGTAGLDMVSLVPPLLWTGRMVAELLNESTNLWVLSAMAASAVKYTSSASGFIALTGTLTRVKFMTISGGNFSAGSANVIYE
jgi:hypothetical protein